jgi:hypothetical protein
MVLLGAGYELGNGAPFASTPALAVSLRRQEKDASQTGQASHVLRRRYDYRVLHKLRICTLHVCTHVLFVQ